MKTTKPQSAISPGASPLFKSTPRRPRPLAWLTSDHFLYRPVGYTWLIFALALATLGLGTYYFIVIDTIVNIATSGRICEKKVAGWQYFWFFAHRLFVFWVEYRGCWVLWNYAVACSKNFWNKRNT